MSDTILITGGAGFIGSNLVEFFLKKQYKVIVLDDLSTGKMLNVEPFMGIEGFTFIEGDIRNMDLLEKIFGEFKIDFVSHQAARGSVPKSVENPLLSNDINVNGTLNILWMAKKHCIKKVVCAISSSLYGETEDLYKKETLPVNPMSPYAVTKATNEMYCKVFNDLYKLPTVGLRYFNVYGKKQDPDGDYAAVVPKFITSALADESLFIFGDGLQSRDFTFIGDVVNANYLALQNESANGRSFNVGAGQSIEVNSLALKIIELAQSKSKIEYKAARLGDIRMSLADLTYAKKYLKYSPEFDLSRGLKETIDWYVSKKK